MLLYINLLYLWEKKTNKHGISQSNDVFLNNKKHKWKILQHTQFLRFFNFIFKVISVQRLPSLNFYFPHKYNFFLSALTKFYRWHYKDKVQVHLGKYNYPIHTKGSASGRLYNVYYMKFNLLFWNVIIPLKSII